MAQPSDWTCYWFNRKMQKEYDYKSYVNAESYIVLLKLKVRGCAEHRGLLIIRVTTLPSGRSNPCVTPLFCWLLIIWLPDFWLSDFDYLTFDYPSYDLAEWSFQPLCNTTALSADFLMAFKLTSNHGKTCPDSDLFCFYHHSCCCRCSPPFFFFFWNTQWKLFHRPKTLVLPNWMCFYTFWFPNRLPKRAP